MEEDKSILERHPDESDVVDAYSRVAPLYNVWSYLTESKAAQKVVELAEIRDGQRILEVALGTGLLFARILRLNRTGETFGVDLSPAMIAKAKKHLEGISGEHCHLQIANAYHLPFDSNAFDLLINNFMLDLLPEEDFTVVLREFHRVVKPGGLLVVSTMSFGKKWYNAIWYRVAKHFPQLLTGCRPVEIRRYLEKTGFELLQSVRVSQNTFPSEIVKARKNMDRILQESK
jgi:ubiquinone/menaquinone biosynthesis C-methylase UbiE